MKASENNLLRLTGEYMILKDQLARKKLAIIKMARELGIQKHIMIQMDW